jgi:hypothetical protein
MIFGDEYKIRISSLCNFLHSPVTSSLFGPNIILRTLFSNTVILTQVMSEQGKSSWNDTDRGNSWFFHQCSLAILAADSSRSISGGTLLKEIMNLSLQKVGMY